MLRRVSVETGLQDIKAHLSDCGYQVVDMAECISSVEAVVYTGTPVMSVRPPRTTDNTVIINAKGLSVAQVAATIEEKLG